MTSFWNIWIILPTVLTFIVITWILFANRKTLKKNEDNTTGHEYDGIVELDNPLPLWWLYMFVITLVFGALYLVFYPGLGSFKGVLGWTSDGQWQSEVDYAEKKYDALFSKYRNTAVEALSTDKKAIKMGRRLFANNCAQCHGVDAKGAYGIPNLTDTDWLYGDTPEAIKASITQGRKAAMPAWGSVLKTEEVAGITKAILNAKAKPLTGNTTYQSYCSSCHGSNGEGNTLFGAPNLTDTTWLYGGTDALIQQSIFDGRSGEMPAHEALISSDKIHLLTAYVYSFRHVNKSP